jgi:signal peptidase II
MRHGGVEKLTVGIHAAREFRGCALLPSRQSSRFSTGVLLDSTPSALRICCTPMLASHPTRAFQRVALAGLVVLFLDQLTKWIVRQKLSQNAEYDVLDGFFKFVHWGNTGAAWSLLRQNNNMLAFFSAMAIFALWYFRRYFEYHRIPGQIALGLLFGGIVGNLIDRLIHDHVVDFLRFYWRTRTGDEIGFPAFNVADSCICTGVGIIIWMSWTASPTRPEVQEQSET